MKFKLWRRADAAPVRKGASEVEAAYLAWTAEMADHYGVYYDPDGDGDNDAAAPDRYTLTRLGSVSQGTLWKVCDNSYYWGEVYVLDVGDAAEVFLAKSASGDELLLSDELAEWEPDLDKLGDEPGAVLLETLKAKWSRKYIDALPDDAFLYIEDGGKKDDDGKTEPRSLRHFPYKNKKGDVDLPHLRDAIGRIPQSDLPDSVKESVQAKAEKLLAQAEKKSTEKSSRYEIVKTATVTRDGKAQQYTLGVAYPVDEVDSHGDYTDAAELEQAAWHFMASGQVFKQGAGTDHANGTDLSGLPVESYIYRGPDWLDEDGETVIAKSGDWMLGVVWTDDAWERIASGELTGYSIQGMAVVEDE